MKPGRSDVTWIELSPLQNNEEHTLDERRRPLEQKVVLWPNTPFEQDRGAKTLGFSKRSNF
jgi:hypothetical protein